jgi:hypothetical protein
MPDDKLTSADPSDLADAIAFAVIFSGRKRVHDRDRFTARIAGDRTRRHLENAGYVVLKKPPTGGQMGAMVSVMIFWGVGFAALSWLAFEIAEWGED